MKKTKWNPGDIHNPFKSWSPINIPLYAGSLDESSYDIYGQPYTGRHQCLGQNFTTRMLWTPDYHLVGRNNFSKTVRKGTVVGCTGSEMKEIRHRPLLFVQREMGAKYVVLQMHGNGYDIGLGWDQAIQVAAQWQSHVILPEYPGYGEAPGRAGTKDVEWAVISAALFVMEELKIPHHKLILMGFSIGTGAATFVARFLCEMDRPPAALILHAPFTSLREESIHFLKFAGVHPCVAQVGQATFNRFKTKKFLPLIDAPVLILHGDQDEIVPYWMGQKNAKAREGCPHITKFITLQGCTHNEFDDNVHIIMPGLKFLTESVPGFYNAPPLPPFTYPAEYNQPPEDILELQEKSKLTQMKKRRLAPMIGCMCLAASVELFCGAVWLAWRGVKKKVVRPLCPSCVKAYEFHVKGVKS